MKTLACNRCGECCKQGGSCLLRKWIPELNLPYQFEGRCEFLTDVNECSVMAQMKKQGPVSVAQLQYFTNLNGQCDWPHLRIADQVDGDYT